MIAYCTTCRHIPTAVASSATDRTSQSFRIRNRRMTTSSSSSSFSWVDRLEDRRKRSTGIFPRGGAVSRYTDLFQIAPNGGTSGRRQEMRRRRRRSRQLGMEQDIMANVMMRKQGMKKKLYKRVNVSTLHPYSESPSLFYHSYPHVASWEENGGRGEEDWNLDRAEHETGQKDRLDHPNGFFSGWKAKSWNRKSDLIVDDDGHTKSKEKSSLPYVLTRKESDYEDFPFGTPATTTSVSRNTTPEQRPKGNTIIYRYFGRSVTRSVKSNSIPFIVIAPSTDHWKIVGKILAARGFNVMVCERTKEQKEHCPPLACIRKEIETYLSSTQETDATSETMVEGEALTSAVLDALKWQKAILVGCDEEASLAIEAALKLAPDRVAGLVLCGDLSGIEKEIQDVVVNTAADENEDDVTLDGFLSSHIGCPCSIIWDGDASSWSTSHGEEFDSTSVSKLGGDGSTRSVIIGGGLAPHRRMPEQFAWTLTRFVENRVSLSRLMEAKANGADREIQPDGVKQHIVWRDVLPPGVVKTLDEIFAPGSLLVMGRVIATAIIYLSITRVSLFHYHNIRAFREVVLNRQNFRNLWTIPGLILQRRWNRTVSQEIGMGSRVHGRSMMKDGDSHPNRKDETMKSDDSFESIRIDSDKDGQGYENDKIQLTPPTESAPKSSPDEQQNNGDNAEDESGNISKPFPAPEKHLDGQYLQKFLFFDQIVS